MRVPVILSGAALAVTACAAPLETERGVFYLAGKSDIAGLNQSVMSRDPSNVAEIEVDLPVDTGKRAELALVFCNALNPATTAALLGKPEPATSAGGPTRYAVTCVA